MFKHLFKKPNQNEINPSHDIYGDTLIELIKKTNLQGNFIGYENFNSLSNKNQTRIYNEIIDAYVRKDKISDLFNIIYSIQNEGFQLRNEWLPQNLCVKVLQSHPEKNTVSHIFQYYLKDDVLDVFNQNESFMIHAIMDMTSNEKDIFSKKILENALNLKQNDTPLSRIKLLNLLRLLGLKNIIKKYISLFMNVISPDNLSESKQIELISQLLDIFDIEDQEKYFSMYKLKFGTSNIIYAIININQNDFFKGENVEFVD